eukprot:scaffold173935_cov17-Tisochrysis_lutea.AAC.1
MQLVHPNDAALWTAPMTHPLPTRSLGMRTLRAVWTAQRNASLILNAPTASWVNMEQGIVTGPYGTSLSLGTCSWAHVTGEKWSKTLSQHAAQGEFCDFVSEDNGSAFKCNPETGLDLSRAKLEAFGEKGMERKGCIAVPAYKGSIAETKRKAHALSEVHFIVLAIKHVHVCHTYGIQEVTLERSELQRCGLTLVEDPVRSAAVGF